MLSSNFLFPETKILTTEIKSYIIHLKYPETTQAVSNDCVSVQT